MLRLVYKPHSVQWLAPSGQSSLWAARRRAARCGLPGTGFLHTRGKRVWRRAVSHRPQTNLLLLGLAPDGGYLAICIAANAGGLLRHLFTITAKMRLSVSVALFRRVSSPPRMLSDVALSGVRTFLDPVNAEPRLPNQPEFFYHTRAPKTRQR